MCYVGVVLIVPRSPIAIPITNRQPITPWITHGTRRLGRGVRFGLGGEFRAFVYMKLKRGAERSRD